MVAPAFVDVGYAADLLQVPPDVIFDWIATGKLRTYGGKSSNPFVRLADVTTVLGEAGTDAKAEEPPRRGKSPSSRVQARLTADARWGDLAADDIREWVRRADPMRRQAARTAARVARERLEWVMSALDDVDGSA